jgi:hypothetical protein
MNVRGKLFLLWLLLLVCFAVSVIGIAVYFSIPRLPETLVWERVDSLGIEQPILLACNVERAQCYTWQGVQTSSDTVVPYVSSKPPVGPTLFWLVRDAQGVTRAFVPEHPGHLECVVGFNSERQVFYDPCYGSKFRLNGAYLEGPSPRGLNWYPVRVENGNVWIEFKLVQGELHP